MVDRESRLSILRKVARGEISIEESSVLLKHIEADEAAPGTEKKVEVQSGDILENEPIDTSHWKEWWIIPFIIFLVLTGLAGTLVATSYINNGLKFGFWISLVFLLICLFGTVVSIMAKNARWIHIRVKQAEGKKPAVINLSFPLPLRFARWVMDNFKWAMPDNIKDKNIGEAIQGFEESVTKDQPFHVLVDEDDGDHIEVFIG